MNVTILFSDANIDIKLTYPNFLQFIFNNIKVKLKRSYFILSAHK